VKNRWRDRAQLEAALRGRPADAGELSPDNEYFSRLVISAVLVRTLSGLKLSYLKGLAAERKELEAAKQGLLRNQ
jgi:hypothetical protein